jgi:recombinase
MRAAMAAQVVTDGRCQGGRAPYGSLAVDAGPHPDPRKAYEGNRLRVLAIDNEAAAVVERIVELYFDGLGMKSIAETSNVEGVPCPSAHTPQQNRHRRALAGSTPQGREPRDPRYSGFAIYGRRRKVEGLLDPEDVAAGHVVRFRRSPQSTIVRSRQPARPVVSVDTFARSAGVACTSGERPGGSGEAGADAGDDPRVRLRRTLVPGPPVADVHPANVYLREDHLTRRRTPGSRPCSAPRTTPRCRGRLAAVDDDYESASRAIKLAQRIRTRRPRWRGCGGAPGRLGSGSVDGAVHRGGGREAVRGGRAQRGEGAGADIGRGHPEDWSRSWET